MCETVGRTLPEIIVGNSETGHLRIGQNTAYHGALARCWALGQVLISHVEASNDRSSSTSCDDLIITTISMEFAPTTAPLAGRIHERTCPKASWHTG